MLNRMPSRLMNLDKEPSAANSLGVPIEKRLSSAIVERNGRFIIMVIYGYQPDAFPFAQQTLFPIPLHQIPVPVPRTGFHGRPQGGNADVQFDSCRSLVPRQDFRFAEHADKGVADKLFRKGSACPVAVRTAAAVQNIARLYFVLVFAGVAAERDRRRIVYP